MWGMCMCQISIIMSVQSGISSSQADTLRCDSRKTNVLISVVSLLQIQYHVFLNMEKPYYSVQCSCSVVCIEQS